jgi:hypothetical protein
MLCQAEDIFQPSAANPRNPVRDVPSTKTEDVICNGRAQASTCMMGCKGTQNPFGDRQGCRKVDGGAEGQKTIHTTLISFKGLMFPGLASYCVD